ncbi:MAG: hypothetical protein H3Z52_09360 [archaeon]|nr:hypothetical protein [archaeon]MCP8321130.1 hypothetical protein [archaeon]
MASSYRECKKLKEAYSIPEYRKAIRIYLRESGLGSRRSSMKLEGLCLDYGVIKCFRCGKEVDEVSTPWPETAEEKRELSNHFGTSDIENICLCNDCKIEFVMDYVMRKGVIVKEFWDGDYIGYWNAKGFW